MELKCSLVIDAAGGAAAIGKKLSQFRGELVSLLNPFTDVTGTISKANAEKMLADATIQFYDCGLLPINSIASLAARISTVQWVEVSTGKRSPDHKEAACEPAPIFDDVEDPVSLNDPAKQRNVCDISLPISLATLEVDHAKSLPFFTLIAAH